jgi:hypothetical protein
VIVENARDKEPDIDAAFQPADGDTLTAKLALVAPAATVTELGVVKKALLDARVTVKPPAGAGALR